MIREDYVEKLLTPVEYQAAIAAAKDQYYNKGRTKKRPAHDLWMDNRDAYGKILMGCVSEFAVCLLFGWKWNGGFRAKEDCDRVKSDGGMYTQVRATGTMDGGMWGYETDQDSQPFIGSFVERNRVIVWGWCWGWEFKRRVGTVRVYWDVSKLGRRRYVYPIRMQRTMSAFSDRLYNPTVDGPRCFRPDSVRDFIIPLICQSHSKEVK